jgi:imidazolonepropionase-like amidohydrolase
MLDIKSDERKFWLTLYQNSRIETTKLWKAGINLGTGTDVWQLPIGAQWELERLVDAGLPPIEAIHAATGASAQILGADKDLGTIEVGKWADLVILDADPLVDIHNTRRIWQVFQSGAMVDRNAILKVMKPQ